MSYAVRNTIILVVTLLLIAGIGYGYHKFFLEGKIEKLETDLVAKQNDFNTKQDINNQFEELNRTYQSALSVINNYDKALYPNKKPDDVYDYLNELNEAGSEFVYYDYVYSDSIPDNQYGILQSTVSGYGNYEAVTNFINRIENSQLLNKVIGLTISPSRSTDGPNSVNFSFTLDSYYQKTAIFDSVSTDYQIKMDPNISTYNPLYPLIQSTVPANTEGLINAESISLVGMTGDRIFIKDSERGIISLKVGDRVYLGYLADIDLQNKRATFNLNKGGIEEVVTLEVKR